MGGFLSLIGGAGNTASHYGEQIRGLLESRRHDFADMISKAADQEIDPGVRDTLRGFVGDLATNKPMEKIAPKFIQLMQQRHQGNQALAQAFGGAPAEPPPPPPGPAGPGQTPGTVGQKPVQATASAAQPALSPVQPQAQGSEIAPVAPQASVAPSPAVIPPVTPGGPQDPMAIYQQFSGMPEFRTPAGRAAIAPIMDSRIRENETLRREQQMRQMDLGERQKALDAIKASEYWKNLPDIMKSQYELWAHSTAAAVPAMNAALMRPVSFGGTIPSNTISDAERLDANGNLIDAKASPYLRQHINLATGQTYYTPATGPLAEVATPNGLTFAPRVTGGMPEGALPPSALNPRVTGVNPQTGQNQFNDIFHIRDGTANLGVAPGSLPTVTSSTVNVPGQLPQTTSSTRTRIPPSATPGAPAPRSGAIPPVSPGGGTTATPTATGGGVIGRKYDDWAAGGPAPTGKDLTAVQDYAAKHNLPTPTQMSANGQKSLAAIDPIMDEVTRVQGLIDSSGLGKLNEIQGKARLAKAYAEYAYLHTDTPDAALISSLSFADLRSAAQALQGTGSRAYPILVRALEHTPVLGINSDSPQLIKKKLGEMATRLKEARAAILEDEKKSGVVAAPNLGPVAGTVEDGYRFKGGDPTKQENWEKVK